MTDVSVPSVLPPKPRRRLRPIHWAVIGIIIIGLFFTILVPSMCRSRPIANRIKSQSNLRQIAIALTAYAKSHESHLPMNWSTLVADRSFDLTSNVFISPSGNDEPLPAGKKDWGIALDDLTSHHCSYRYTGDGLNLETVSPDDILAYEPIEENDGEGTHLLFGDGHVEWYQTSNNSETTKSYGAFLAANAAGQRPLRWPT